MTKEETEEKHNSNRGQIEKGVEREERAHLICHVTRATEPSPRSQPVTSVPTEQEQELDLVGGAVI